MMAKTRRKQPIGETRKQAALSQRDRIARKRVLIGVIVGSVVIAGVIIAGLLSEFVLKPASPVAVVNGERITTEAYQKMVRYQRAQIQSQLNSLEAEKARLDPESEDDQAIIQFYDQMIGQAQAQLANVGPSVLDQMIEDILIRQGAGREGIVVTEEEVDQKIEELFGYERNPPTPAPTPSPAPTATPFPTPTPMSREEFERIYEQYMAQLEETAGFTQADFRALVRDLLYREALQERIESRVPTAGEQVHARHILVEDEETARTVLERLRAGEDFSALAEEFSIDPGSKSEGGDLGWFTRGRMVKAFEDVAFSLPVGEISEPVQSEFGYHIIKVEGHETNREFDSQQLSQLQATAFDDWLAEARQNADIQRSWTPDKVPPTPTPAFFR